LALKEEAENVRDRADRIVRLVLAAKQAVFYANESEDADIQVTPATRQNWAAKVSQLKDEIKTIVGGW